MPRDVLSDSGGQARPPYLCCPFLVKHTRVHVFSCPTFSCDERRRGGRHAGGGGETGWRRRRRRRRGRERERKSSPSQNQFPRPRVHFINQRTDTHTHTHMPFVVLASCQTHPGFHLWPASPLQDGTDVLAAASSHPLLLIICVASVRHSSANST